MTPKNMAILVDAGYFFAQASEVLFGKILRRDELELHEHETLKGLEKTASGIFPDHELLRIYWYDAPPNRQQIMSTSQEKIALCEGVKLRLGRLNGHGQQKGVDALIGHDLVELARHGAIHAAVLISGDDDLTLAMETAQSWGVQVKILGLGPGNASISQDMAMSSDGVRKVESSSLKLWVKCRAPQGAPKAPQPPAAHSSGSGVTKASGPPTSLEQSPQKTSPARSSRVPKTAASSPTARHHKTSELKAPSMKSPSPRSDRQAFPVHNAPPPLSAFEPQAVESKTPRPRQTPSRQAPSKLLKNPGRKKPQRP